MATFETIEKVATEITSKLNSKKVALLYAFNGVGKTRLSRILGPKQYSESDPDQDDDTVTTLGYNAYFEDLFYWDNESLELRFSTYDQIIKFIIDQGLDGQITSNFQELTQSKVLPEYDFQKGAIAFVFSPGDDRTEKIKISRGEESLFIWSVFYTVVSSILTEIATNEEDKSTHVFDNLSRIIIDDPVSSIDDTRIVHLGVKISELINSKKNMIEQKRLELSAPEKKLAQKYIDIQVEEYTSSLSRINIEFVVLSHHPLFYNVLHNSIGKEGIKYLMTKNTDGTLTLDPINDDSPFGYHLATIEVIKDAIDNNKLEKYHFNLLRVLLEKTANFLGYKNWKDCIAIKNKDELIKHLHLNSHGKLSDLEVIHLTNEQKEIFTEAFRDFIEKYNFSQK
jgi:hypothetical protein